MPSRLLRRLLFAPLLPLATFFLITTLPLWVLAAAAAVPFIPGRWRPLRVLWMVLVYLIYESLGIAFLLALWVRSGFGARMRSAPMQEAHYTLMRWFLSGIYDTAVRVLKLEVVTEQREGDEAALLGLERPLLVFSRHAGPGDSFLLIHDVLVRLDRRPRIVLKDMLQYDPCVDIVLNRLPNRFITSDPEAGEAMIAAIGDLAEDMGERDALVIFPEGGNFTERRRARAIDKLRSLGHGRHAEQASRMHNVVAPRPGGALAALRATPQTDIMFVAHTGLEDLSTIGSLWRGIPMDQRVRIGWWTIPEEEVPGAEGDQIQWLFDEWAEIDAWIDANRAHR